MITYLPIFPPIQMYVLLAIVATICTIVASNIRQQDGTVVKFVGLVMKMILAVASVSVFQICVDLIGKLIAAKLYIYAQVVLHILCILILYLLLVIWYAKSVRPKLV